MGPKKVRFGGLYEPLNNYVVEVKNRDGECVTFKTLAHTPYHAREKIYAKFCHLQDDIEKYSMGKPVFTHNQPLAEN